MKTINTVVPDILTAESFLEKLNNSENPNLYTVNIVVVSEADARRVLHGISHSDKNVTITPVKRISDPKSFVVDPKFPTEGVLSPDVRRANIKRLAGQRFTAKRHESVVTIEVTEDGKFLVIGDNEVYDSPSNAFTKSWRKMGTPGECAISGYTAAANCNGRSIDDEIRILIDQDNFTNIDK